jgi:AcrR family transcriptional regulator
MATKKPRRTAERILEVTLELFNRFGEPNVSTTLISAELNISPGNLYYHYPAKDELINSLFDRYERALNELLQAAEGVRNIEDAWLFFHMLFELIWQYRFLYRDLNDLLSKNRRLETHFQFVLKNKSRAVQRDAHGPPPSRARRQRDGGRADLLAQLRVRARPAQGTGTGKRRLRSGPRRVPCAMPADAVPGPGGAGAPAHAGRRVCAAGLRLEFKAPTAVRRRNAEGQDLPSNRPRRPGTANSERRVPASATWRGPAKRSTKHANAWRDIWHSTGSSAHTGPRRLWTGAGPGT